MSSEFQSDRIKSDFLRLRPKFAAEKKIGVSLWMKHSPHGNDPSKGKKIEQLRMALGMHISGLPVPKRGLL
jgi:hypothetical protein